MAANSMGKKGKYKYTMDDNTVIKLRLDSTLGSLAACGLSAVTTADNAINKPLNFKPRVVYWQSAAEVDGVIMRKELVCSKTAPAFISVDNFTLEIDGVAGQTTGRRGETISF